MTINKLNFNFYGILLVLSIFIGVFYIYYSMIKSGYKNKKLLFLYFLFLIISVFIFGKLFTIITSKDNLNLLNASFSSYGGVIGILFSSLTFEKLIPTQNKIVKYSIISLPLIYSISKIGCFCAGCCYGIPYNGIFSVTYTDGLNIPLFPIQITETIVFLIIFIICNKLKNNNNIIYITITISALSKFLLDFLRYEHINKILSTNQIFSILLIIITVIIFIKNKKLTIG